jgi:hypothetical protein
LPGSPLGIASSGKIENHIAKVRRFFGKRVGCAKKCVPLQP